MTGCGLNQSDCALRWLRETSSRDGLLVSWSQLGEMRDATATEIDDLMAEPALHPQTMALTTTNKRLVALRREASLRDRWLILAN